MSGFRLVNRENVFRVCDQPHPLLVKEIVGHCGKARLEDAYRGMSVRRRCLCRWSVEWNWCSVACPHVCRHPCSVMNCCWNLTLCSATCGNRAIQGLWTPASFPDRASDRLCCFLACYKRCSDVDLAMCAEAVQ